MTGSILRTVARRTITSVVVLWGAATSAYLILVLAPGDPVDVIVGDGADTPGIRAAIIEEWGFDRPAVVQYFSYLWRIGHGDFGRSYLLQRPVVDVIGEQVWPTIQLAVAACAVAIGLAVTAAIVTAGRPGLARRISSATELTLVSTPTFLIGVVLLTVFSFRLGMFPVSGAGSPAALVLPALTLGLPIAGVLAQLLRDGLERALDEPFTVTARARGLDEGAVLLRHGLRHAAVPVVTLLGWIFGTALGGAVIVELVFGRPGLGQVTIQAVTGQDMPVMLAVVTLSAAVYVVASTAADLACLAIDPRLRGELT